MIATINQIWWDLKVFKNNAINLLETFSTILEQTADVNKSHDFQHQAYLVSKWQQEVEEACKKQM